MTRLLSNIDGRGRVALLACVVGAIAVVVLSVGVGPALGAKTREITLVARDMSFYLEGQGLVENPVIMVRPRERVRVVLRNEDSGLAHNFAIRSLGVAIQPFKGAATRTIEFRAPKQSGRYEYSCTPHALMMRGVLEVAE